MPENENTLEPNIIAAHNVRAEVVSLECKACSIN